MFGRATITLGIGPHSLFQQGSVLTNLCDALHHGAANKYAYGRCDKLATELS